MFASGNDPFFVFLNPERATLWWRNWSTDEHPAFPHVKAAARRRTTTPDEAREFGATSEQIGKWLKDGVTCTYDADRGIELELMEVLLELPSRITAKPWLDLRDPDSDSDDRRTAPVPHPTCRASVPTPLCAAPRAGVQRPLARCHQRLRALRGDSVRTSAGAQVPTSQRRGVAVTYMTPAERAKFPRRKQPVRRREWLIISPCVLLGGLPCACCFAAARPRRRVPALPGSHGRQGVERGAEPSDRE